ncbi:hypothetical protein [Streptomyces sp. STCH 565 A]|uniref:hypothetical protein n=1 Tax=Streptomyces sp. STCH 565 A TaxID=2950532 RepID=UPI002075E654|nr:hypothetical protein [Streptomyces sp. STCH 565 A]MCM8550062.1 hypothetical protein [Streptomyces sp. STCH 565 A]
MRNDIKNHLDPQPSLAPAARTTSANGTGVDLANFDAAMVVIDVGTWTNGSHAFEVQDSDDNASWAAVDAAFLDGAEPVVDGAADDGQVYTVGYHGIRRYLRVAVTVTGSPETGAAYGASVVRGKGRVKP